MADKTNQETEAVSAPATEKAATKESAKPAAPKKDKLSFFKKIGKFLKESKAELKKIVWYSKQQTFNSTLLVIVTLILCSAAISILDFSFSSAISALSKLL